MVYETIYKQLLILIPNIWEMNLGENQTSKATGFMNLHLDILAKDEHSTTISLAHYYEQNGDLVSDPDMEIKIYKYGMAEALTYQDSYIFQRVYPEANKAIPKLKKQLNTFLSLWLKNCIQQGHIFTDCPLEQTKEDKRTTK